MTGDGLINRTLRHISTVMLRSAWVRRRMDNFAGVKKRSQLASKSHRHRPALQVIPNILVCTIAAVFFWFLASRIAHYFSWPQSQYEQEELFNLTTTGVPWDVFYGHSPQCGALECHLTAAYAKENFLKSMVLPAREFPLKDYKKGQIIYLRTTLQIPPSLLAGDDTIMLHSLYIWAKRYSFYINEQLVNEGANQLVNISIPRAFIAADGKVAVAFRIDPGNLIFQGLANNAYLVVGPGTILQKMAFAADEVKTTYYLWFLLPIVTLAVIFIFIFLLVDRKPASFVFILYSFFTAAGIFLNSEYPEIMLPWSFNWRQLMNFTEPLTSLLLLMFIHDFFYENTRVAMARRLGIFSALSLVCLLSLWFLSPGQAAAVLDFTEIMIREGAILYGTYLCALSAFYHSESRDGGVNSAGLLLGFFVISAVIVTVWFTIRSLKLFMGPGFVPLEIVTFSFNLVKVFDLAFFVTLAGINTMEVGVSFARKKYVEKELQDAANIAIAFQPDPRPNWPGLTIDVFHRPLTEASGDWFAFKRSPSGRYCHYILCDITGHGIQAALVVSTAKTVLSQIAKAQQQELDSPVFLSAYMQALGGILYNHGRGHHTLTFLGITFDLESNDLYHISAGHPFPFLISGSGVEDMKVQPLVSRTPILGSVENPAKVNLMKMEFPEGSQLLCYTDGIPLKQSRDALKATFAKAAQGGEFLISPSQLFKTVWDAERLKSGRRPEDDTSVIIFKRERGKLKAAS